MRGGEMVEGVVGFICAKGFKGFADFLLRFGIEGGDAFGGGGVFGV